MRKRPFLVTGITSFFVALIGANLSLTVMYIVACCLVTMMIVCALGRRMPFLKSVAVLCGVAAVVVLMLALKTGKMVRLHTDYDGAEVSITARIMSAQKDGAQLDVRVESGGLPKGTRLHMWAGDIGSEVREGDLVFGQCQVVSAFDSKRPQNGRTMKADGTYLYAWPTNKTVLTWHDGRASMNIVRRVLTSMRQYIYSSLDTYTTFAAPLCKAMMMGERDGLSEDIKTSFRACGIYHVLAVSGLHLSVLVGAFWTLLRVVGCPRRWRSVITMAAVLVFMALCNFSASVTRAGMMTLIALSSTLFRRRADGLNSLGLAATVMLLVDPFTIYDVGWQLSFAATVGLLCIGSVWQREITDRTACLPRLLAVVARPISTAVGVTVCATLTTMPITAYWYGELSVVSWFCNVLLVPPAGLLLIVSFVGTAVGVVWPWMASHIFGMVDWLARLLCAAAFELASIPRSVVWGGDAAQVLWLFGLPLLMMMAYRWFGVRGVGRAIAVMSALAVLIVCGARFWWNPSLEVRVADCAQPTFTVRTDDEVGVVIAGDATSVAAARRLLSEQGEDRADWIVWIGSITSAHIQEADILKTDRLILTQEPAFHTSLPTADQTYILRDGETARLTPSLSLAMYTGVYRLETEEATLLTAMSDAEFPSEFASYLRADAAILSAQLPLSAEQIEVSQAIVCGEEYDVYRAWHRLADHKDTALRSPQTEEAIRLLFR